MKSFTLISSLSENMMMNSSISFSFRFPYLMRLISCPRLRHEESKRMVRGYVVIMKRVKNKESSTMLELQKRHGTVVIMNMERAVVNFIV